MYLHIRERRHTPYPHAGRRARLSRRRRRAARAFTAGMMDSGASMNTSSVEWGGGAEAQGVREKERRWSVYEEAPGFHPGPREAQGVGAAQGGGLTKRATEQPHPQQAMRVVVPVAHGEPRQATAAAGQPRAAPQPRQQHEARRESDNEEVEVKEEEEYSDEEEEAEEEEVTEKEGRQREQHAQAPSVSFERRGEAGAESDAVTPAPRRAPLPLGSYHKHRDAPPRTSQFRGVFWAGAYTRSHFSAA